MLSLTSVQILNKDLLIYLAEFFGDGKTWKGYMSSCLYVYTCTESIHQKQIYKHARPLAYLLSKKSTLATEDINLYNPHYVYINKLYHKTELSLNESVHYWNHCCIQNIGMDPILADKVVADSIYHTRVLKKDTFAFVFDLRVSEELKQLSEEDLLKKLREPSFDRDDFIKSPLMKWWYVLGVRASWDWVHICRHFE
jgi:hypothetical protein